MLKLIIIGSALVATAAVAQNPQSANPDDPNATICRVISETGSRLNRSRVCMTRAQWAEQRRQIRENVDRSQNVPHERQY